jgi:diacylglycerol kinase (ATP)
MKPGKSGFTRLIDATGHSMKGIRACWEHEAAFRLDVMLSVVLFIAAFYLAESAEQWLVLILPLFLILIVELLNSAVENAIDRIGPERHHLSGRAKDMGSAAVFFCLVLIAISWGAIAWQNLT